MPKSQNQCQDRASHPGCLMHLSVSGPHMLPGPVAVQRDVGASPGAREAQAGSAGGSAREPGLGTPSCSRPASAPHPHPGVSPSPASGQTFSLRNISTDMSGYYICTASNRVAAASCNITVAVRPRKRGLRGAGVRREARWLAVRARPPGTCTGSGAPAGGRGGLGRPARILSRSLGAPHPLAQPP